MHWAWARSSSLPRPWQVAPYPAAGDGRYRKLPKVAGFPTEQCTCLFPPGRRNWNLYGSNWLLVWFPCVTEPCSSSALLLSALSESLLMYVDSQLYPAIWMIQKQIEMSSSLQLSGNIKIYQFLLNFHQIGSFRDRSVHLCSFPPNTRMT